MRLDNCTKEKAQFQITTSNGREINIDMEASTAQDIDLSKYRSPFSVLATIADSTTEISSNIDGNQTVSLSGGGYVLKVDSTA